MRPQPPKHVRERRAKRHNALVRLGYRNYSEYVLAPHWKAVKARYRASDLPQNCICGETEVQLHHMTYERVGAERLTDLTPLCHTCHALIHVLEFRGEIGLAFEGFFDSGRATDGRAMLVEMAERQRQEVEARLRADQEAVLQMSFAARLLRARDVARFKRRVDVSHQIRILKREVDEGKSRKRLTRSLRIIEERAYGWDGWRDFDEAA